MTGQLTRQQTERLAAILDEQRDELTSTISSHLAQHKQTRYTDLIGQVGDLEDRALAELLVDDEMAGIQRQISELREVQAAADRLERGDCGRCIDCGERIVFERLLAWPTATRCISCQETRERTHTHPDHPTL